MAAQLTSPLLYRHASLVQKTLAQFSHRKWLAARFSQLQWRAEFRNRLIMGLLALLLVTQLMCWNEKHAKLDASKLTDSRGLGVNGGVMPEQHTVGWTSSKGAGPALRLIVLTAGTRYESLRRLLESACALLNDGDRIDMDVWIDLPSGVWHRTTIAEHRALAKDIETLGRNGTYRHGVVRAHVWSHPVGLVGQWLDAWDASVPGGLMSDTREIGLYLEDDVEISPLAWRWLKAAHAQYSDDPRVAGFSLQRLESCAYKKCPPAFVRGGPDNSVGGFLYPVIGTWGFAPVARSFAEFRKWYYSLDRAAFKPYVDGILPTDRFKRISSKTSMQNAVKHMWSMYHVKYTDTHDDKYTVYVKCKNGAALAISYEEPGLNDSVADALAAGKQKPPSAPPPPLLTEWDVELLGFSANPVVLTYNGTINATASQA
jgi:hypothetical protein